MAGPRGRSRHRVRRRAHGGSRGALPHRQGEDPRRHRHVVGEVRAGAGAEPEVGRRMFARGNPEPVKTRVVAQCRDADFERLVRSTFGMDGKVELSLTVGAFAGEVRKLDTHDATVVIVDIDPVSEADFAALNALTQRLGGMPPVIVAIPSFDVSLARQLLQMRVADFVVKPVAPLDLVRACARAAQGAKSGGAAEATIYTFLPAAGGVGLTTLATETTMLRLKGARTQK